MGKFVGNYHAVTTYSTIFPKNSGKKSILYIEFGVVESLRSPSPGANLSLFNAKFIFDNGI